MCAQAPQGWVIRHGGLTLREERKSTLFYFFLHTHTHFIWKIKGSYDKYIYVYIYWKIEWYIKCFFSPYMDNNNNGIQISPFTLRYIFLKVQKVCIIYIHYIYFLLRFEKIYFLSLYMIQILLNIQKNGKNITKLIHAWGLATEKNSLTLLQYWIYIWNIEFLKASLSLFF